MAKRQENLDRGVTAMLALSASSNDVQFKVTRGVTRPVWEPDGKVMALYDTARGIAKGLGYDITSQSSGGGSDGNFTGAMGIATLARSSAGLVQTYRFIVEQDLARGDLVELLPQHGGTSRPFLLLYPHARHLSLRVRTFVDFLVEKLHPH